VSRLDQVTPGDAACSSRRAACVTADSRGASASTSPWSLENLAVEKTAGDKSSAAVSLYLGKFVMDAAGSGCETMLGKS